MFFPFSSNEVFFAPDFSYGFFRDGEGVYVFNANGAEGWACAFSADDLIPDRLGDGMGVVDGCSPVIREPRIAELLIPPPPFSDGFDGGGESLSCGLVAVFLCVLDERESEVRRVFALSHDRGVRDVGIHGGFAGFSL